MAWRSRVTVAQRINLDAVGSAVGIGEKERRRGARTST
jgi:hypothetical protein